MPSNVGSLQLTGECFLQSNASSLLTNLTSYTISWFAQYNSVPTVYSNLISTTFNPIALVDSNGHVTYQMWGAASPPGQYQHNNHIPGVVYHIVMTWTVSGSWYLYINGVQILTGTAGATASPWTTSQLILVGSEASYTAPYVGGNIQLSNLAIWQNYAATVADIKNLRDRVYDPSTLIGSVSGVPQPATTWFTLADAASGTPGISDNSFVDQIGTQTLPNLGGTFANASYAAPLVYVPPTLISPYVSKCGKTFYAMAQANAVGSAGISGTVSVNSASTSLTTSANQAGWVGQQLLITGDSSNTTYTIQNGIASAYTIAPVYGGSSNAVAANATLVTAYPVSTITAVNSNPTINVQFGGVGTSYPVAIDGPVWTNTSGLLPCAAWQLLCGPVESVLVQNPGSVYSASPSVSASGGGGTGLTLGTPVISGGVTAYHIDSGGSGYADPIPYIVGPPIVVVDPPSISITGTLASGSASVTGISSTAGLYPGMTVLGTGPEPNAIASIVSGTAISLYQNATITGSTSLTVQGKPAACLCNGLWRRHHGHRGIRSGFRLYGRLATEHHNLSISWPSRQWRDRDLYGQPDDRLYSGHESWLRLHVGAINLYNRLRRIRSGRGRRDGWRSVIGCGRLYGDGKLDYGGGWRGARGDQCGSGQLLWPVGAGLWWNLRFQSAFRSASDAARLEYRRSYGGHKRSQHIQFRGQLVQAECVSEQRGICRS